MGSFFNGLRLLGARHFLNLGLLGALVLVPCVAHAKFISAVHSDTTSYFLYSAPNKIARFDLESGLPLEDIPLAKVPTAFDVHGPKAYVAFHEEVNEISLETGETTLVKEFSSSVVAIGHLDGFLYIQKSNSSDTNIVRLDDLASLTPHSAWYSSRQYVVSAVDRALYFRDLSSSPSDIHKLNIAEDGTIVNSIETPYHGDYPSGSTVYINGSEDKVYDSAGIIYYTADLTYAGSLGGAIDALTFVGDNSVSARGLELYFKDRSAHLIGQVTLLEAPSELVAYDNTVYAFTTNQSNFTWQAVDISSFSLPDLGETISPQGLKYDPAFIEYNESDLVFLVDTAHLSIFAYSVEQQDYVSSWKLRTPPSWTTFSVAHQRLYLGYSSGEITYFDVTAEAPTERQLITLATSIKGLLAVDDYLFAADGSGFHYLITAEGTVSDSQDWRNSGSQYAYNADLNRIYFPRGGDRLEWSSFDPLSGLWLGAGESPYQEAALWVGSPPLIVSGDNQLLLNGGGEILDANSLTMLNALTNRITAGAWVGGRLVTIDATASRLQFWSLDFELLSTYPLVSNSPKRLFGAGGLLTIVRQVDGAPSFAQYDLDNLADSDADGIHDLADNCLDVENIDQLDFDADTTGDACDGDSDNDGIKNERELELGLNPLDHSDAAGDLDTDGFSNLVEEVLGTDALDPQNNPQPISYFMEDFENGLPSLFYQSQSQWSIYTEVGAEKSSALGVRILNDQESDLSFTALFPASTLSFKMQTQGSYGNNLGLEVLIDGVSAGNYFVGSPTVISLDISAGLHEITFRATGNNYSSQEPHYIYLDNLAIGSDRDDDSILDQVDNCPNSYNYWQEDTDADGIGDVCDPNLTEPNELIDSDQDGFMDWSDNCPNHSNSDQADVDQDGLGDACDETDGRPVDTDGDSFPDSYDNCPLVANEDQENMDGDQYGDVCDSDIDNDGVINDIENLYDSLDPYDAQDVHQDPDGDGVPSGFEVANGNSPEEFDEYTPLGLTNYYPIKTGRYILANDYSYYGLEVSYFEPFNQYVHAYDGGKTLRLESREGGLYLVNEFDQGSGAFAITEELLFIPKSMALGEKLSETGPFYDFENSTYYSWSVQLVAEGNQTILGEDVHTVTIETTKISMFGAQEVTQYVYADGIGLVGYKAAPLQLFIALNASEAAETSRPEPALDKDLDVNVSPLKALSSDNAGATKTDAAGAFGALHLLALSSLVFLRRRRR